MTQEEKESKLSGYLWFSDALAERLAKKLSVDDIRELVVETNTLIQTKLALFCADVLELPTQKASLAAVAREAERANTF